MFTNLLESDREYIQYSASVNDKYDDVYGECVRSNKHFY